MSRFLFFLGFQYSGGSLGTKAHGHSTSHTSAMKLLSAGSSAKYANPSERSVYCLKNCLESLSLTGPKATFLSL